MIENILRFQALVFFILFRNERIVYIYAQSKFLVGIWCSCKQKVLVDEFGLMLSVDYVRKTFNQISEFQEFVSKIIILLYEYNLERPYERKSMIFIGFQC